MKIYEVESYFGLFPYMCANNCMWYLFVWSKNVGLMKNIECNLGLAAFKKIKDD